MIDQTDISVLRKQHWRNAVTMYSSVTFLCIYSEINQVTVHYFITYFYNNKKQTIYTLFSEYQQTLQDVNRLTEYTMKLSFEGGSAKSAY